jgi:large exoprotein involved in heme utilization and adhesion
LGIVRNISITASEQLLIDGAGSDSFGVPRPSMIMTKNTFSSTATGSSGNVAVNAPDVLLTNGGQIWTGTVRNGGEAGDITVNAQTVEISGDSSTLFDPSGIYAVVGSSSQGGDMTVTGETLIMRDRGELSIANSASGTAGTMRLNLTDAITLETKAKISADANNSGNAGAIDLTTGTLTLRDSSLVARALDAGQGGEVSVNARQIALSNLSQISTTAFNAGNAGQVELTATEKLLASGASVIGSQVNFGATGAGGAVNVNAGALELREGSQISTGTFGIGNAGAVNVNVAGTATIAGTGTSSTGTTALSGISSQVSDASATGNGGTVNFKAGNLILQQGGNLTAGTIGGGTGGNLTVEVSGTITIEGVGNTGLPSAIAARTLTDRDAGNLSITTHTLHINDFGEVTVAALNPNGLSGNAGNLTVNAQYIRLTNNATITGSTTSGQGGNLDINALCIIMLFDSEISTTAGTANLPGDGGNININTGAIAGLFNSDIASNSFRGRGGRIVINAQGIFGLEFRLQRTAENDITAISLVNPVLNGEVVLNTPDIDPTQALIDVPIVESPEVVERVCTVRPGTNEGQDGQFSVSGRAVPTGPLGVSSSGQNESIIAPLFGPDQELEAALIPLTPTTPNNPLIAQGWGRNAEGQLVFTGATETPAPQALLVSAIRCR